VRHFQSRKFPWWGYEVSQGATTILERWDSLTKEHGFQGKNGKQNAQMNSFAHYSFGAVCEWMFNQLAGIQSDGPAYKQIIIHPMPPTPGSNPEREAINWVKAHHDSIRGRVGSEWQLKKGKFELNLEIPANTTATVYVPAASADQITESGKPLSKAKGVQFLRLDGNSAVLAVGSGKYKLISLTQP